MIFASQAKVPAGRAQRERVLRALAALAARRPDLRVVVKLRSAPAEMQTHRERHHYQSLWDGLLASGEVREGAVHFENGPMRAHLARGAGFVTVSSTAALEAIDMAVPLLVLSDVDSSNELLDLVFADSGCLGTLDDLVAADFRTPDPDWCARNYFHDAAAADWQTSLADLIPASRQGSLTRPVTLQGDRISVLLRYRARLRLMVHPRLYRVSARLVRQAGRVFRRAGRLWQRHWTRSAGDVVRGRSTSCDHAADGRRVHGVAPHPVARGQVGVHGDT